MNDYRAYVYGDYNSIYHHGVKGQKWGKRRYQNEDGSLTPEGRERYQKYLKRFGTAALVTGLGVGALAAVRGRQHHISAKLGNEHAYQRLITPRGSARGMKHDVFAYRAMKAAADEYGKRAKMAFGAAAGAIGSGIGTKIGMNILANKMSNKKNKKKKNNVDAPSLNNTGRSDFTGEKDESVSKSIRSYVDSKRKKKKKNVRTYSIDELTRRY